MMSGGSYTIKDSTETVGFPVPLCTWQNQFIGDGLNGIPALNAYRLHTMRWTSLDDDYMSKLVGFQTRQQTNNAQPVSVETKPYDPECSDETYRTVVYDDAIIKGITREGGFGLWQNVSATFEILVTGSET